MTKIRITPLCTLDFNLYRSDLDRLEPVIDICERAKKLKRIVILGFDSEGDFYYDTNLNNGDAIDLLDIAKKEIIYRPYEDE